MMTEDELRRNLRELDTFWERELARRGGTGNPMPPADCYWYIYTRQAYLEILGQQTIDDEDGQGSGAETTTQDDTAASIIRFDRSPILGQRDPIYRVMAVDHDMELGTVEWHWPTRQYMFYPADLTSWTADCLHDIRQLIHRLAEERGPAPRSGPLAGGRIVPDAKRPLVMGGRP